jgi:glycogen(starch) synthase
MDDAVNHPLRVLLLSREFPPVMGGGLGRHVQGLSTALAEAGHRVTVLTREVSGCAREEHAGAVRVLRLPTAPPHPLAVDHALTMGALAATAGDRYDIVHVHDPVMAPAAVAVARRLGAGLVATVHTVGTGPAPVPDAAVRAAVRVVVCSRFMLRRVVELLHLPPRRVAIVGEGADPRIWQAGAGAVAAARLRFAGVGPLIGYAGRLVADRGVADLITALPVLRQRNPGLRAVIAGDGPERAQLRRQARLLRLERAVSFTGYLDHGDLVAILAATDALVVPGGNESSGMIALEGAAAGTPLAVAGTGGLAELVESGVTAVTFPPGDPDALAGAVDRLLADRVFARRLAARARMRVSTSHTWAAAAAGTAHVYADVIGGRDCDPAALAPVQAP